MMKGLITNTLFLYWCIERTMRELIQRSGQVNEYFSQWQRSNKVNVLDMHLDIASKSKMMVNQKVQH